MSQYDYGPLLENLAGSKLGLTNETAAQDSIEEMLKRMGVGYEREASLSSKDRIDFLVEGKIGIEVKVSGSLTEVTRQVARYLDHDEVEGVVLVSTRPNHAQVPRTLRGKTVMVYVPCFQGL